MVVGILVLVDGGLNDGRRKAGVFFLLIGIGFTCVELGMEMMLSFGVGGSLLGRQFTRFSNQNLKGKYSYLLPHRHHTLAPLLFFVCEAYKGDRKVQAQQL